MSQQLADHFMWNGIDYVFLGAEDIDTLFNGEKYGLHLDAPYANCSKGFVISFSVRDNELYFDSLLVKCDNDVYPPINGVEAKEENLFYAYKDLNLKLNYSGTVIIGRNLDEKFLGRYMIGPYSYREVHELKFLNGELIEFEDTSGRYTGF